MVLNLSVPELKELKPKITVFGVGGAGGNAINNMIQSGLSELNLLQPIQMHKLCLNLK